MTLPDKKLYQMGTNEACTACYESLHLKTSLSFFVGGQEISLV